MLSGSMIWNEHLSNEHQLVPATRKPNEDVYLDVYYKHFEMYKYIQSTAVIILSFIYICDSAIIGYPRATIKKGKRFHLFLINFLG